MDRRDFMAAVAALAGTRWEREDVDPDAIEGWPAFDYDTYTIGEFTPETTMPSLRTPYLLVEDFGEIEQQSFDVWYDSEEVYLDLNVESEDIHTGFLSSFSSEDAFELAAAIYQAAWEQEKRAGTESIQEDA